MSEGPGEAMFSAIVVGGLAAGWVVYKVGEWVFWSLGLLVGTPSH